jgi:hypothetical protein
MFAILVFSFVLSLTNNIIIMKKYEIGGLLSWILLVIGLSDFIFQAPWAFSSQWFYIPVDCFGNLCSSVVILHKRYSQLILFYKYLEMRFKRLWRWYIITSIKFLDIIHRLVHFLKNTTFRRQNPVSETLFFKKWTIRWIMSKTLILVNIWNIFIFFCYPYNTDWVSLL